MSKSVFTNFGQKVTNILGLSLAIALILFIIDFSIMQDNCNVENEKRLKKILIENRKKNEDIITNESQKIERKKRGSDTRLPDCKSSQMIANIYNSLFVSIITLWFIELTLHPETIKEIEKIFKTSKATKYIKSFYRNNDTYNEQIRKKLRDLGNNEEVKLLGLVKDMDILTTSIDEGKFTDKLKQGCKFKILLVHPGSDNSLLKCLQKSHKILRYKDENSIISDLNYFQIIADNLERDQDIKGEIEVRLQKNTYSSICYFSTNSSSEKKFKAFIWMYFFNENSLEYPAFEILEKDLLNDVERHFEHLWKQSDSILKYNGERKDDSILKFNSKNLRQLCNPDLSDSSDKPINPSNLSDSSDEPLNPSNLSDSSDEPLNLSNLSNSSDEPLNPSNLSNSSDKPINLSNLSNSSDEP